MAPSVLIDSSPAMAMTICDLKSSLRGSAAPTPAPTKYTPAKTASHLELTGQIIDAVQDPSQTTVLDGYTLTPGQVVNSAK